MRGSGSGNNLTFEFKGDASQLNAEIERVKLQIQGLRQQARAAFRGGDTAGVGEYTSQIGKLQTNLAGLNRTLANTGNEAVATGRSMAVSARSFRSLDQAVLGLGRSLGDAQAGIAAFAAFRGFSALYAQIEETRKKLAELRDLAQQTMQTPAAIKAAQDIVERLGLSGEVAKNMLTGVAEALAKVRTEAGAPVNPSGLVEVINGTKDAISGIEHGVLVLRGSSKIVFDLANAYQLLGINLKNYKGTQEDTLRLQRDVFAAFERAAQLKLFDPVQLNEMSKALFKGASAAQALKAIPEILRQINDEMAKNPQIAADFAAQEALDASTARLKQMVDERIAEHNRLWTEYQTSWQTALAKFIEGIPQWVAGWEQWKQGNKAAVDDMVAYVEGAATRIANALSQAFASARQTLATSFPGDPSIPAMPMAAGGYIRGPGTATSDSILARVSAGEYVMRARAVDHWGPQFMAQLNAMRNPFAGFADGGFVMPQRSVPHFAEGGLVAGPGGQLVASFHFDSGGAYRLAGPADVVNAMVKEAHQQQMRSAGTKPSWYGGRPGR